MFRDYLQFEKRSKNETKSQMENPFPPHHPLHHHPPPHRLVSQEPSPHSQVAPKKITASTKSKSGGKKSIPRIKEGSARVLNKSKEPNPYTGMAVPSFLL
jgi:hypothetical protein